MPKGVTLNRKKDELVNAVLELRNCDSQDLEDVRRRVEAAVNWIVDNPSRAITTRWTD